MEHDDGLSVLVVEDEPNVRLVAATYIESLGLTVYEAGDADEALDILQEHPEINLVFTDVRMPGTDGLTFVQEIAKNRPKIEVIVTSGKENLTSDEIPGFGTFLPKPYQPSHLKALIEAKLVANGLM